MSVGGPPALDDGFVLGGGMAVGGTARVAGVREAIAEMLEHDIPAKLAAGDATLWGKEAEAEARVRLGWLRLPQSSRKLASDLRSLRDELVAEGLTHVVLAGMGGSSLAPEVISRTLGKPLTVLDTTDPRQVRSAIADRLEQTVVVVSSKSGGTVETDSHRRAYLQAFKDSGLSEAEAGRRFVVVTDPGSPLERVAQEMGAREIFLADPEVGGRYSALSAFGLVPTALVGVDVVELLDEAAQLATTLSSDGPVLRLGTALGQAALHGRNKLILAEDGSGVVGLGDWIEQLVAESTGKNGKGILPVVVERPGALSGGHADDALRVTVGGALQLGQVPGAASQPDLTVNAPLGAHFLAWEYATAIAGYLLGINPFDQPNVAESKENTGRILESAFGSSSVASGGPVGGWQGGGDPGSAVLPGSSDNEARRQLVDAQQEKRPKSRLSKTDVPSVAPFATTDAVELYGDGELFTDVRSIEAAIAALIGAAGEHGYLAIMAYLDRWGDSAASELRTLIARRTTRPVTFGWGPRFLHSTGQYHKGGPADGAFLQVTGETDQDLPIAGKPYSFGGLQAAQAAGDREALTNRNLPLLRIHLRHRAKGIDELLEALR